MGIETRLNEEIESAYQEINRPDISKSDLVRSVVDEHLDLAGQDSEFARRCVEWTIEQHVRKFFNLFKAKPVDTERPLPGMEGFKRLQKAYLLPREGEQKIVLLHAMTEEEMTEQSKMYRTMGAGCYEHADELDRFRDNLFATD